MVSIGVCWSPAILEHKLERVDEERSGPIEEVWNCRRLPQGLGKDSHGDRLFVACRGSWVGFFRLVPEVLYNPQDPRCPYALIFDARSWRSLDSDITAKPFRGWTYSVPTEVIQIADGVEW